MSTKTAITKVNPVPAETIAPADPAFNTLRGYLAGEKGNILKAVACMALAGMEIERLRKVCEVKRGGDRKSNPQSAGLIPWATRLKEQTGLTEDTAARRVLVFKSVKARSATLQELQEKLLNTPFEKLPPEEQAAVTTAVKNACDGETAKSLMQEHGVAKKDKGSNLKSDRHKGGNSTVTKATIEEEAQSYFGPLFRSVKAKRCDFPNSFARKLAALPFEAQEGDADDLVTISDLYDEVAEFAKVVKDVRDRMSKAAHASHTKDAKRRQKEVTKKLLSELPPGEDEAE